MDEAPSLFGDADPVAVRPAAVDDGVRALAARLPPGLRLGTSSWSFPGWVGHVYADRQDPGRLSRDGLPAYTRHPLLRTVGVDRAWYAPVDEATWRTYAAQVPDDFRFLVKGAAAALRPHDDAGRPSPTFLDVAWSADHVVGPLAAGLGAKAGVLLLQFSPMTADEHGAPDAFAERLARYLLDLARLPGCPPLAVEVRNRALLVPSYADALRAAGAAHVHNVFPGMPTVATQARVDAAVGAGPCVVRWMLHPRHTYQGARRAFAPFDRLADPLPSARDDIARVLVAAHHAGRPAFVIANNKAEGCAPLTLLALASRVAEFVDG
ncbi:MAG: DUF72 domain-containing protein [Alphaproteobacteria bacterium]|nr:DUF72 domain-containing protein [Alphaproteobacteria bacterium]